VVSEESADAAGVNLLWAVNEGQLVDYRTSRAWWRAERLFSEEEDQNSGARISLIYV